METASKTCALCDKTPCTLGGVAKDMWLCAVCNELIESRLRLRETESKKTESKEETTWDCECRECGKEMNDGCQGYCDPRRGHKCICDECYEEEEEDEGECPGCLRPKSQEGYCEVNCRTCGTEMCDRCHSYGPEGDDEVYCKRCVQDVWDRAAKEEDE